VFSYAAYDLLNIATIITIIMHMFKQAKIRVITAMAAHSKLVTFGIAFAITIAVAITAGIHIQDAYAGNHIHIPTKN
jgi:hypothetical protein